MENIQFNQVKNNLVGKQISHYLILEKLGTGGMGVVYKAEDTKLKRSVALKFLTPDLTRDSEAKQRFIQEAQSASALDHPNICTIYEIDETVDGQLFISMACYEGEILKKKLGQGPLKTNQALDITTQVAQGLAKAHSKGIVHRDIKSANLFITDDGQAKILDFGLAKLAGQQGLTKSGTTVGTIEYISPEQARGDQVDLRTDIWSLGVVLYEMLTGQLPFKGENWEAVIYSIFHEAPRPIQNLRNDLPESLIQVMLKMMEKEVENRYDKTAALITDLKSIKLAVGTPVHLTIADEKPSASIAVLPFVDLSQEKDQEYFCDGFAEELINGLTHIKNLRVVARTSTFSFKGKSTDIREIGKRLNVETILEGSVRKAGTKLRITSQLINVSTGYHLWSERYDRDLKDIFAIQDEISLSIVDKLKVKLFGEEKARLVKRYTENMKAYQFCLKGRYFFHKMTAEDLNKSIDYYNLAIKEDPSYALAYAGLAGSLADLGFLYFVPVNEVYPKAKKAAEKAVEIDPMLAEGYNSLGWVKLCYDWDWEDGEKTVRHAVKLNPNSTLVLMVYGLTLLFTGRMNESIEYLERAVELDPLSFSVNFTLGVSLLRAGRLEQTRNQLLKTLELASDHYWGYWILGQSYIIDSKYEEGIEKIELAVRLSKNFAPVVAALGWAYAMAGRKQDAWQVLAQLEQRAKKEYVRPFVFVKIYCGLGEKDRAFEWLEKAYAERDTSLMHILTDESINQLRSDPRFERILEKMGLIKYKIK